MTLPRRAVLPSLLLLSACNVGPFYRRPDFALPPVFQATADNAAAAWPEPGWWRGFQVPELDALIEAARLYNTDLVAAGARVLQADAQVRISGSPLLPQINGQATYEYDRAGLRGAGTSSGQTGFQGASGSRYFDSRTYRLGLQVSYDFDLFGRNRALFQAAKAIAIATRFDQETVALSVVTSVASTYFQVLAGQDRLRVAERNLKTAQQVLDAFRARLTVGTASALDVSQQEALVAGQTAVIPGLRNTIAQNRVALGILVGTPPERLNVVGGTLDDVPLPPVAPGLPSELLLRRPDVAFAEAELISQNANIRAARAAFFPDITLTGSQGLTSAAFSTLTGPGTLVTQLVTALSQPIFNNGLLQGQLDLAKGRFAELAADYAKAILQSFTDTEQSLDALRFTTEQEALTRQTVAVAQRSADIAAAQLQAGTIDIITSLNVQTTLFSNLDLLVQVRLTRFQALINLYKALGGGWRQPGAIEGARP